MVIVMPEYKETQYPSDFELQVGDRTVIKENDEYYFTIITEVTPSHIKTQRYASVRFDRTTGDMIRNKYKRCLIHPEEAQAEIDRRKRWEKLVKLTNTRSFTQEEFEKLEKAFNEILKDE